MRVVIAGPRDFRRDRVDAAVERAVRESGFQVTEVVSGNSGEVDLAGERWAQKHGVPLKLFPYPQGTGRAGGPIRNRQMAKYASEGLAPGGLLVVKDERRTSGTASMIHHAGAHSLRLHVVTIPRGTCATNIRKEGCDVYVGRGPGGKPTRFGNPWTVEEHGYLALDKYRSHFLHWVANDPSFRRDALSLRGKRLGCFCVPYSPCHADIIAAWVDAQPLEATHG